MNLYESNIQFMKTYYPHYYHLVTELYKEKSVQIDLVKTKTGHVNFSIQDEDSTAFLHSQYDPYKEASYLIPDIEAIKDVDSLIIHGFGLGHHIEYLNERFPFKNKIIIEPNVTIFQAALRFIDMRQVIGNKFCTLLLSQDFQHIANHLSVFANTATIYSVQFLQLTYYKSRYINYWDSILRFYHTNLADRVINARTLFHFRAIWMYNSFRNLKHLKQASNLLVFENAFKNVPAIIVSCGPSLKAQIETLKTYRNKALIIAAGSAINPMIDNGLRPHFMLGLDGGADMSEIYNMVDGDDITLCFSPIIHFDCLNKHNGKKIYFKVYTENLSLDLEEHYGINTPSIIAGSSVANVCNDFVAKLGCNPIIFAGQDFAYTNGLSRSEDALGTMNMEEVKEEMDKSIDYSIVEDKWGKPVYTTKVLLNMRTRMEMYIRDYGKGRMFFNTTYGGLAIKGVPYITFPELEVEYLQEMYDIDQMISELHETSHQSNPFKDIDFTDYFAQLSDQFKWVLKMSKKRITICEAIIEGLRVGKHDRGKMIKVMNHITDAIERKQIYKTILINDTKQLMDIHKNTAENRIMGIDDNSEKLTVLYEHLLKQYREVENVTDKYMRMAKYAKEGFFNE